MFISLNWNNPNSFHKRELSANGWNKLIYNRHFIYKRLQYSSHIGQDVANSCRACVE